MVLPVLPVLVGLLEQVVVLEAGLGWEQLEHWLVLLQLGQLGQQLLVLQLLLDWLLVMPCSL